jgi:3-deoxy-D-manno-octulosonic-acid transferase
VAELASRDEKLNIVIANTTNTGFNQSTKLYGNKHQIVRYPLDLSNAVAHFLDRVQPDVVATVELEVWPHMTEACHKRGIPICVINGRISDRSFPRYAKLTPLLRPTFSKLSAAAMQTRSYADRIMAMGTPANRVHVLDTMKWDAADLSDTVAGTDELATAMGIDRNRPVVVLGSTGEDEEILLTEPLQRVLSPEVQIIIVPRKPERFDAVAQAYPGIVRRSQYPDGSNRQLDQQRYFLVDTLGELRKVYCLGDVVIVGRSFNRWGGSDPIEPVALGKPVLYGPDHRNFTEVANALREGGGIIIPPNPATAATDTARLLVNTDEASKLAACGQAVIRTRLGATQRHADLLFELLNKAK